MQNKKAIADTFVWIAGIIIICFLGILVFGLVVFLGNKATTAEDSFSKNRVYPEKAYNLYALLISEINGKKVGERIVKDDFIHGEVLLFMLKRLPSADKENFQLWDLQYVSKEVADKLMNDENLLKKSAVFPLQNNKNAVLSVEQKERF